MLRDVADSLFNYLIDAFPADRPYARAAFAQAPTPPLVAHFLAKSLQERFEQEVKTFPQPTSEWIDLEAQEAKRAYHSYLASLRAHAYFPQEAWEPALKQAVQRVSAHLVRPVHTLTDFVYSQQEEMLPAPYVNRKLEYFAAYPYLRSASEAYFRRKDLAQIDRERFALMLARIDRELTQDYTPAQWLRLLAPMFHLVQFVPAAPERGIPITLLASFFEEKGALEIYERLAFRKREEGAFALEEEALYRLLEAPPETFTLPDFNPYAEPILQPEAPLETVLQTEATAEETEATALQSEAASEPSLQAEPALQSEPVLQTEPAPEPAVQAQPAPDPMMQAEPGPASADKKAVPLWKQFQKTKPPAPPSAPPPPVKPSVTPKEPVPLWMRFQKPTPASAPGALDLPDIEQAVLGEQDHDKRTWFVDHLFAGSMDAYESGLRQLHAAPNWTQASRIIADEVFKRNSVNIYSPQAVAFTNAVESRYRQR